jgi:hypothetical protein
MAYLAPLALVLASGCIELVEDGSASTLAPADAPFAGFQSTADGEGTATAPPFRGLAALAGSDSAGGAVAIREGELGTEPDPTTAQ